MPLFIALFLSAILSASEVQVTTWDACLARLRSTSPTPFAVYLGSRDNHMARDLAAGAVATKGIPVAFVSAVDPILNPMDCRPMRGLDLQRFFGGTAGTILFFDEHGIPIFEASVPQIVHGNDADFLSIYFGFVAGGHYKNMTIPDYARALGREGVIAKAIQRTGGRAAGRELPAGARLVTGRNAMTGEMMNPWAESGVFIIYTSDPHGRVFLAQIGEIWNAFHALRPRITVVAPMGRAPKPEELPAGFQGVLVEAPAIEIAKQGPSPHLVLVAGAEGSPQRGLVLSGFQPAEALAGIMHLSIDRLRVNRDIPYSETDEVQAPGGDLVGSAASSPSTPSAGTPATTEGTIMEGK